MISEAILIPKIYARLQKIASNFSKFPGGGPQTPRRRSRLRRSVWGFAPLPPPLPKFLDPPVGTVSLDLACSMQHTAEHRDADSRAILYVTRSITSRRSSSVCTSHDKFRSKLVATSPSMRRTGQDSVAVVNAWRDVCVDACERRFSIK